MGTNREEFSRRQAMFLLRFIDIDSDTFGNGAKSYRAVYPVGDSAAGKKAGSLINSPDFAALVVEAIANAGWDFRKTICRLTDLAVGRIKRTATIEHADGSSTKIAYAPTFADKLFAHDLLFLLKAYLEICEDRQKSELREFTVFHG